MFDVNRLTRCKDSESRCLRWYIFDFDTNEIRLFASGILDGKRVRWHFVQWAARIIEQFKCLVTGVGDCGDNLEVIDPLNSLRACKVEGEARRSRGRHSREK
jgi:hypothetical protein